MYLLRLLLTNVLKVKLFTKKCSKGIVKESIKKIVLMK